MWDKLFALAEKAVLVAVLSSACLGRLEHSRGVSCQEAEGKPQTRVTVQAAC